MTNKEFTSREKGMIKNVAKAVYPMVEKKFKLIDQVTSLQTQIEDLEATISKWEQGVMDLTGGFTSTELVKKEIITCGEGEKAVRKANYTFYYGDSIVPAGRSISEYANSESFNPETTDNNIN